MVVKCSFDATKNKLDYYRGRDCIKTLCKKLRDSAMEIINYEAKETETLTNEEIKSYEKQKICHICKEKLCYDENEKDKFELYHKVRDHCHYTGAHSVCNLRYKVPKKSQ